MPHKPPTFRPRGQPTRQEQRQSFDRRRGSARQRGYSAQWDRAARAFKLAHPLCLGCEAVGRVTAATVVDHVEPHKGDMVKFWDHAQWQPACDWHHAVIKQVLEVMYECGKIGLADLRLDSAQARALTLARDR